MILRNEQFPFAAVVAVSCDEICRVEQRGEGSSTEVGC
jgi:hypothetical protein